MNEIVEYVMKAAGASALVFGLFNAVLHLSITRDSKYQRIKLSRRDTMAIDRDLEQSNPILYKLTPIGRWFGLKKIGFYP